MPPMNTLLVVVRFAHLLAALLLFGGFMFAVVVSPAAMRADAHGNALEWNRLWRRLRSIMRWSLVVGIVSAALWFALEAALVSGLPLVDATTGDMLGRVATQTAFGRGSSSGSPACGARRRWHRSMSPQARSAAFPRWASRASAFWSYRASSIRGFSSAMFPIWSAPNTAGC